MLFEKLVCWKKLSRPKVDSQWNAGGLAVAAVSASEVKTRENSARKKCQKLNQIILKQKSESDRQIHIQFEKLAILGKELVYLN